MALITRAISIIMQFHLSFSFIALLLVASMKQGIAAYHQDDEGHWVAELVCGHFQHVRHDPPMVSRPWVLTVEGRDEKLGYELECKKCDVGAPEDKI